MCRHDAHLTGQRTSALHITQSIYVKKDNGAQRLHESTYPDNIVSANAQTTKSTQISRAVDDIVPAADIHCRW